MAKNKTNKRDPQKAESDKMKLVSAQINKILLDNQMGLHAFIYSNPYNGALSPQVRLVSTKEETNVNETGDQIEAGENQDTDRVAATE